MMDDFSRAAKTVSSEPTRTPMEKPSRCNYRFSAGWRMPALLFLLLAMIVSGCASISKKTGQTSIDRGFTASGFRWSGDNVVYVFVKVREGQGKVEVCAALMPTKGAAYTYRLNTDVLGAAIVIVDGSRVMQGIAFANTLPLMDNVIGQPATCARGTADWKPGYAGADVELKFPRMRFVL